MSADAALPAAGAARGWFARLAAHRVTRNAGALGIVQVVNYGAAFVVLVHLTRVLGVETYGVVAFAIGITQLLSVVLDLGFAMSGTQRVAVLRDDREAVARLAGAVLTLKLLAVVAGGALLAGYALLTEKYAAHAWLFALSALPLVGYALQPFWFFAGIERLRSVTAFTVVARLCFVAGVLLLVRAEEDRLWVPVADGIAQVAAGVTGLVLMRRAGYRIARPAWGAMREALRLTRGFFWSRLAATAQGSAGVILLGLAAAPATVALYALADQLYRAMHAVFAPVTHALYPYMVRERDLRLLARVTIGCVAVAAAGAVLGHFVAQPLVPLVLGADWRPALPVLDVFLVAIVIHAAALMVGYPLAAAVDRLDVANRAVVVGAAVQLALAGVLLTTGRATPTGFAWLLALAELYVVVHCTAVLMPEAYRRRVTRLAGVAR